MVRAEVAVVTRAAWSSVTKMDWNWVLVVTPGGQRLDYHLEVPGLDLRHRDGEAIQVRVERRQPRHRQLGPVQVVGALPGGEGEGAGHARGERPVDEEEERVDRGHRVHQLEADVAGVGVAGERGPIADVEPRAGGGVAVDDRAVDAERDPARQRREGLGRAQPPVRGYPVLDGGAGLEQVRLLDVTGPPGSPRWRRGGPRGTGRSTKPGPCWPEDLRLAAAQPVQGRRCSPGCSEGEAGAGRSRG